MSERALWLLRAREAMQEDGDADFRVMVILEAVKRLAPLAQTPAEAKSLTRLVDALSGLENAEEERRAEVLELAATAWLAFEMAWHR